MFCLSCVELLPLSLGTKTFHFERSCACLFIWLLVLLDELYFHFSSFSFVRNEEFVLGVVMSD